MEEDFVFLDFIRAAVDVGEFIELDFGEGLFFKFFEGLEGLFFFLFRESPEDDGSIGEIENVPFDLFFFFHLGVDDVAEKLGCPQSL